LVKAASGGLTRVTMMQTSQNWQFDDFALVGRFDRGRFRAVLRQRQGFDSIHPLN